MNNLLVLAISPVQDAESWVNIEIFLQKVKLKEICFKFCGDLKIYHEITGIQTARATYPCYGCEARRDPKSGLWEGVPATLRTYTRNLRHYKALLAAGGGVEGGAKGMLLAKHFFNCVNPPMLGKTAPETPLIVVAAPPSLHLKLGPVNDGAKLLQDEWPPLQDWLQSKVGMRKSQNERIESRPRV